MDIYRQKILDHYKYPHNFGNLKDADITQTLYNSACGDKITMQVKFGKDKKTITDIRFSGEGCAISQASSSLLTDHVKGMKKETVVNLKKEVVIKLLGTSLTPSRIKCALLPLEVLQKCMC